MSQVKPEIMAALWSLMGRGCLWAALKDWTHCRKVHQERHNTTHRAWCNCAKIPLDTYGRRDSNPHEQSSGDFKSPASTIPPRPHGEPLATDGLPKARACQQRGEPPSDGQGLQQGRNLAGEAVDGAHSVVATIQSAITLLGLGSLQMLVAGGAFAGLLALLGLPIAFAIIAGFGLGLSSTAAVIGLIRERD